jgi:hypothetical protein
MNRLEAWLSHISTIVVGLSGIAYLWMKYFMQTNDPFALVNHPLQPTMMTVHVVAAPVLTFVLGMVVATHARKKLASPTRSNRISGLGALFTFAPMVVSGYMLQVSTSEMLTSAALATHLVTSGIFVLTYVIHQVVSIRLARTAPAAKKSTFVSQQTA